MRGDLVTVVLPGEFGKPRPALIIQSDQFDTQATVVVLPLTSTLTDAPLARVALEPSASNGLQRESQVMIDKITAVRRERIGEVFGRITAEEMMRVWRSLIVFLGGG